MAEQWKNVEGFPGYQVSNHGNVLGKRGTPLSQSPNSQNGYMYVGLCKNKKQHKRSVHKLVAIDFVDGRTKSNKVVDHIDRDKANNHHTNLRWTTQRGNCNNLTNQSKFGCGVKKRGKKYQARIEVEGKGMHLGTFKTPELAHAEYLFVKRLLELAAA